MKDVLALDALCEFCGHARIHFHCRAVLCLLQYSDSQVSRAWADFENFIRRAEICLDSQSKSAIMRRDGEKEIKTNLLYNSRGCLSLCSF